MTGSAVTGSVVRRLVGAAVLVVLAGCAPVSTAGTATAPSTPGLPPVETVQFDPCALGDDVVAQLQLDPSTKGPYNQDFTQGVETGCRWKNATINSTISLDVGRTTRSVQDYLDNTSFKDIAPTRVGGHDAAQFTDSTEAENLSLAIGVPNGVVILTTSTSYNFPGEGPPDAKTEVERMAAVLEPLLPG